MKRIVLKKEIHLRLKIFKIENDFRSLSDVLEFLINKEEEKINVPVV